MSLRSVQILIPQRDPKPRVWLKCFIQRKVQVQYVVSQSSVVEQHDYLVAEGAIGISNVISTDATNSCSSLSVLITERILVERQTDDLLSLNAALDEWQFFSENVSNLVLTMPDRFNRYRNIERM